MDLSFPDLNYNPVETLPSIDVCAAFAVKSVTIFREDMDFVPLIVDYRPSYVRGVRH